MRVVLIFAVPMIIVLCSSCKCASRSASAELLPFGDALSILRRQPFTFQRVDGAHDRVAPLRTLEEFNGVNYVGAGLIACGRLCKLRDRFSARTRSSSGRHRPRRCRSDPCCMRHHRRPSAFEAAHLYVSHQGRNGAAMHAAYQAARSPSSAPPPPMELSWRRHRPSDRPPRKQIDDDRP